MRGIGIVVALVGVIAVACGGESAGVPGGGDPGTVETVTPTPFSLSPPRTRVEVPGLPALDLSTHTVPLEEVYFDTFGSGAVRLSEASADLIDRLRDAIPPISAPLYDPVAGGDWLNDDDLVIGYVGAEGSAFAYPHKILNFHEIVNDEIDGVPVLISYCPLCRSGVVFDRRFGERVLTFGNTSALFENDLVMYDAETNSYWWQVPGRAIVGALAGESLAPLPSATMTWAAWKMIHPQTSILSENTGFPINYRRDPFAGYSRVIDSGSTPFPTSDAARDPRLSPSDEVLGVVVGAANTVYPLRRLGDAAVNDVVGGRRIVVFSSADGPAGGVFFAEAAGQALTFDYDDRGYRDTETGSVWNLAGRAVEGPLAGTALESPPSRFTFWFAYVSAFPDASLYQPG